MNVLVACEESQTVCKAFRAMGHNAFSCDIIPCSGGHPEWHIIRNVLTLLDPSPIDIGNDIVMGFEFTTADGREHNIQGKWDMIIAFPPCTHLASSGARHFATKRADGRQRHAINFFGRIMTASCDRIAIENPIGIISGDYIPKWFPDLADKYNFPIKPTQIIHPWMFGDNYNKSTCLWLKGLAPLVPYVKEKPDMEWVEWLDKDGNRKRQEKWYYDAWHLSPEERAKVRSKTFPSIGWAMAEQWG